MTKAPKPDHGSGTWALPIGRYVSVLDFDVSGWLPVTAAEASMIEEWGGDIVFMTMTNRQYWARREEALASRTVSTVIKEE